MQIPYLKSITWLSLREGNKTPDARYPKRTLIVLHYLSYTPDILQHWLSGEQPRTFRVRPGDSVV